MKMRCGERNWGIGMRMHENLGCKGRVLKAWRHDAGTFKIDDVEMWGALHPSRNGAMVAAHVRGPRGRSSLRQADWFTVE